MKKKRDIGIELARLIGCLIVIGVHTCLSADQSGTYLFGRGYIGSLLADGVAIFWMITGCFLFHGKDYRSAIRHTAKTIVLPVLLYSFIFLHFVGWFSGESLANSLQLSPARYISAVKDTLTLRWIDPAFGHLWYCYTYVLIMFLFPVLKAFAQWLEKDTNREKWFCILSLGLIVVNDLGLNAMLAFSHTGINAAFPSAILILWGSVLYRRSDAILKKLGKHALLLLTAFFLLVNLPRTWIVQHTGSIHFQVWFTSVGLLCASSVLLFCIGLRDRISAKSGLSRGIAFCAGYTFPIYLLHIAVRDAMSRYSIHNRIEAKLGQYLPDLIAALLYSLIMISVIFCISLALSILLRQLRKMLCKLLPTRR